LRILADSFNLSSLLGRNWWFFHWVDGWQSRQKVQHEGRNRQLLYQINISEVQHDQLPAVPLKEYFTKAFRES